MPNEVMQRLRTKYPQYNSLDDTTLAQKVVAKYPQYKDSFAEYLNPQPAQEEQPQVQPWQIPGQPLTQKVGAAAMGAVQNAPESALNLVSGAAKAIGSPVQTFMNASDVFSGGLRKYGTGDKTEDKEAIAKYQQVEDFYKQRYGSTQGFLDAVATDPFGVMLDATAVLGGAGGAAKMAGIPKVGEALSKAAAVVDPMAVAGKAIRKAIPEGIPTKLYQKALAASPASYSDTQIANAVKTGIKEQIAINPKSYIKMKGAIEGLRKQVDNMIASGSQSGAKIDALGPLSKVQEAVKMAERSSLPETAVAAIDNMVQQQLNMIIKKYPDGLVPAVEAQAIKRQLQHDLDPFYGELKGSSKEAAKGIAHGWRMELEQLFPEVAKLNKRDSDLIQLEEMMRNKVHKQLNSPLLPMSQFSVGGVASAIGGGFPAQAATFAGAYELKQFMELPSVKSKLAIVLSKARQIGLKRSKVVTPLEIIGRTPSEQ